MTFPSPRKLLLLGAVLLPISIAVAGGHHRGNPREMAEEIGLSPEQTAKVEEITYRHEQNGIDIRARMQKAKLDLKHQLDAATTDEKAAYKALDALEEAHRDGGREKLAMALELKKVLTPEQWQKAEELREEGREEMRERFHGEHEDGDDDDDDDRDHHEGRGEHDDHE